MILEGTGSLTIRGSIIALKDYAPSRRILARIDHGVSKGTASIQIL
jgi:hypothetical protein